MSCGTQAGLGHRVIALVPLAAVHPLPARSGISCEETQAAVAKFNRMQGKLRVSLTHACQLRCKFCHQEGIEAHWRPVHLQPWRLREMLKSFTALGGHYVELTGGEPLLHPQIGEMLEIAHVHSRHITLCTNGLLLHRVLPALRCGHVQTVKVSLHAPADTPETTALLGRAWKFERVSRGIETALAAGAKVQLLYTLTEKNARGLPAVLDLALKWGVNFQLVDLIRSRNSDMRPELGYLNAELLEKHVAPRARFQNCEFDRTGATLKIYRTSAGASWEVKDSRFGLFHSAMCSGCSLKADCGEGVYALRVDALGRFKPCLLRADLDVQGPAGGRAPNDMDSTISHLIRLMMTG